MRALLIPVVLLTLATSVRAADDATGGAAADAAGGAGPVSSCVGCHGDSTLFEGDALAIATGFAQGVHKEVGLSCANCHGGNPDPSLAADMEAAMDPHYAPNPYRGVPKRSEIPSFCGRCHSDPGYMRNFRPDARVDQEREYWTSQHGKLLKTGDTKVATCIDCHGVHGIRRPSLPSSPVYPTHVAETCRHCHGDADHMAGYKLPDGRPLPIDQYARWSQSVHAHALIDKEDLTAPTCNDCHGNHGAAPPGLESIAFVCGRCHGRESDLFRASPKFEGFHQHEEYLESAGSEGCAACHDGGDGVVPAKDVHTFSECTTCHGNHGIVRPTVAMLAPLPETPCGFCHQGKDGKPGDLGEPAALQRRFLERRDALLAEAAAAGLDGSDRFDWLVDRILTLEEHTVSGSLDESGAPVLRPEFQHLFDKFRIGKTYYTYQDPATGRDQRGEIVRCDHCHAPIPDGSEEAGGYATAARYVDGMRQVTATTATAERMILDARRGGVETKEAGAAIDQAVNSQIELEVLVHTFAVGPETAFEKKQEEGVGHAREAITLAGHALGDLAFRRKGLAVSLILIALVLVGLGLKIRQLSS